MKKGIIYIVSILVFIAIVLSGCIRADIPEKEYSKDKAEKSFLPVHNPYPVQTKTIDGVDYLLSRSPAGKYGGVFVTSTIGEGPKTFNSWNSMDATSSLAADIMFDGLVTTDAYTGEVIPRLAKDIEILPDKKT